MRAPSCEHGRLPKSITALGANRNGAFATTDQFFLKQAGLSPELFD